jgi:hypothetical protein
MKKKEMAVVLVCALFGLLMVSTSVCADSGEGCAQERPLTKAEKDMVKSTVEAIKKALPVLPADWELIEVSNADDVMPAVIYSTPGCPVGFNFRAEYANNKQAMKNAGSMDTKGLDKLMKEMQEAAAKGDMKRVELLQKQLAGVGESAESTTAMIDVHVNLLATRESREHAASFSVAGAQYAFFDDTPNDKKAVLYVGRWKRKGGGEINADVDKNRSNAAPQAFEIVINGGIAKQLAESINVRSIAALAR